MDMRHDFLLLGTLVALAATPSFGQTASLTDAPSGNDLQSAVPDFSGVWTKPYLGIEPPRSGPGPVTNTARRRQLFDVKGRPLSATTAPLVSSAARHVGEYANPILKPAAAAQVKKHGASESGGMTVADPRNQCWPEGLPYVFRDVGMTMLQQPDQITFLYDYDHEIRRVRMNHSQRV